MREPQRQIWPWLVNAARAGDIDGFRERRIVEDDEGVLAAELEGDALEHGAGVLADPLADSGGAGEGNRGVHRRA